MNIFESKVNINRPVNVVYQFLADMNNHRQLMPDNIQDWTSTNEQVRFRIQNMAALALKMETRLENREIKIVPSEKPPFEMELKWLLAPSDGHTEAVFTITADLNMMMKMLASGPLQKLADHQTQRLTELLGPAGQ